MKSRFDFSSVILTNAQKLGKEAIEVSIFDLIYTKNNLDESLIKKYMAMTTSPPPILVINTNNILKIVDGHHRVELYKRKGFDTISIFLC